MDRAWLTREPENSNSRTIFFCVGRVASIAPWKTHEHSNKVTNSNDSFHHYIYSASFTLNLPATVRVSPRPIIHIGSFKITRAEVNCGRRPLPYNNTTSTIPSTQ